MTRRFLWAFLWMIIAPAACLAQADQAGRRMALVIGNGEYATAAQLPKAANDGRAFARFLQDKGFETELVLNATRQGMAGALATFSQKLTAEDTALFYYSGHGMQIGGENYFVAVDAQLSTEPDPAAWALTLADIAAPIKSRAKIALFFIDTSRNNPFPDNRKPQAGSTAGPAPAGTHDAETLMAFATAPGQVALDGTGSTSPFTSALIVNLSGKDVELGTAFKRVMRDVLEQTAGTQSPQLNSSLSREFRF